VAGGLSAPKKLSKKRQRPIWGERIRPSPSKKMRIAKLGKKHTPQAIAKMVGRKDSVETVQRKKDAANAPDALARNRKAHLGKKMSSETREKIRLGALAWRNQKRLKREQTHVQNKLRDANLPEPVFFDSASPGCWPNPCA
jgi:hypothetical protein